MRVHLCLHVFIVGCTCIFFQRVFSVKQDVCEVTTILFCVNYSIKINMHCEKKVLYYAPTSTESV